MSISEQVKELREYAKFISGIFTEDIDVLKGIFNEAADTIEALSAKLQAANMERLVVDRKTERLTERTNDGILVKEDYGDDVLKTLYQCYGAEPMPHYANCDEGYCAMEKLAQYEDLEGQREVEDDWIPCSERLPEEKINPITKDFCEYQVTFKSEDVTDIRHYKFGMGHWWNGPGIMDEYVIAWRKNLEPYHKP